MARDRSRLQEKMSRSRAWREALLALDRGSVEVAKAALDEPFAFLESMIREAEAISRLTLGPPSCAVACSGCCHGPIPVLPAEIPRIVDAISRLPDVVQRCRDMAALDDSDAALMPMPCPALDPVWRTCRIYDVRPLVCQSHHSRGDPLECEPGGRGASVDPQMVALMTGISYVHGPPQILCDVVVDALDAPEVLP